MSALWEAGTLALIAVLAAVPRWVFGLTLFNGTRLLVLQYVEHLVHGQGLVFNPGERVLAHTLPLQMGLYALGCRSPWWSCEAWATALDFVAGVAPCLLLYRLGRLLVPESRWVGFLAAWLMSLSTLQVTIVSTDSEYAYYPLAILAAVYAYANGSLTAALCWGGVATLARLDGCLLPLAILLVEVVRTRRVPWRAVGGYLAIVGPWLVFATWYFGSPMPTYLSGHPTGNPLRPDLLWRVIVLFCGRSASHAALLPFALWGGWLAWQRWRPLLTTLLVWLLLLYAAYELALPNALATADYRHTLFLWLYFLLAGFGLWEGAGRLPRSALHAGLAAAVAVVTAYQGVQLARLWEERRMSLYADAYTQDRALGEWLQRQTPPDTVIATIEAGPWTYYARRRILELDGGFSPEVIVRSGYSPDAQRAVLREQRPAYAVTEQAYRCSGTWFTELYRPLKEIGIYQVWVLRQGDTNH